MGDGGSGSWRVIAKINSDSNYADKVVSCQEYSIWIEQLYTDIAAAAKLPLEDLLQLLVTEEIPDAVFLVCYNQHLLDFIQTNTMIFQNYFFSVQEVESNGLCRFHHLWQIFFMSILG